VVSSGSLVNMAWRIKQKPEDFIVREVLPDEIEASWKNKIRQIHGRPPVKKSARYLWFTLTKRNMDFFRTIEIMAKKLHVSTRLVSYSGTKDKRAVTSQTISVLGAEEKDILDLKIPGLEFSDFRPRNRPVRLGEHHANRFAITVRNVTPSGMKGVKQRLEKLKRHGMINLFGEQRFGSVRRVNHIAGKYLAMGDVENAVCSFLTTQSALEPDRTRAARKMVLESANFRLAANKFPASLRFESVLISHLAKNPGDYDGAVRRLPLRLLKMFVHAYQAHIWNMAAMEYSNSAKSPKKQQQESAVIPLVGYKTNLAKYPAVKGIVEGILVSEGVKTASFRNKKIPELSSAGSARDFRSFPKNLEYVFARDELNKGRMKIVLDFELGKGSYGTELIRQISPGNTLGD